MPTVGPLVVVGALDPCGWCWDDRETRSRSGFPGWRGLCLYLYRSFSIQKVHCCDFPGGAVTNVVGIGE